MSERVPPYSERIKYYKSGILLFKIFFLTLPKLVKIEFLHRKQQTSYKSTENKTFQKAIRPVVK